MLRCSEPSAWGGKLSPEEDGLTTQCVSHAFVFAEACCPAKLAVLCSALRDKRFAPIQRKELQSLQCTVSLLHSFEAAANWQQWSIGVHGLIINFTDPLTRQHRTATFLPEIAAHEGWTHMEAIDSLVRKSGFSGSVTHALRDALRLTRYQSTAQSLTYQEWHDRRANASGLAKENVGHFPIPVVA